MLDSGYSVLHRIGSFADKTTFAKREILHAVLQELECFWRNLWDASDKV